ncbi:MAG TPA: hypothetical protein VFR31_14655 [Thermoanaerobaculia bacterium]|nr:hypothetical protein [Thermoanaerobaculia bacterium]
MKKSMLVLAAVLTLAAWTPTVASAAKGSLGDKNMSEMLEPCPDYNCLNFYYDCENPGGTVISLTPHQQCSFFGSTYTVYTGLCQMPPATFWDDVCWAP